jgi:hypothetical protein
MNVVAIILVSLPFLHSADAYIVAPESITVEQLVATPLATAGSGISISVPDTMSNYVHEPLNLPMRTMTRMHSHSPRANPLLVSLSDQCRCGGFS